MTISRIEQEQTEGTELAFAMESLRSQLAILNTIRNPILLVELDHCRRCAEEGCARVGYDFAEVLQSSM